MCIRDSSTSVGAAGVYHGLGKTFPGATTPYGMVQVSPNTITGVDNGSGYSDEHKTCLLYTSRCVYETGIHDLPRVGIPHS